MLASSGKFLKNGFIAFQKLVLHTFFTDEQSLEQIVVKFLSCLF